MDSDCEEKLGNRNKGDGRDVRALRDTCNKKPKHLEAAPLPNGEFPSYWNGTLRSLLTSSLLLNVFFLTGAFFPQTRSTHGPSPKVVETAIPPPICPASKLIDITAKDHCSGHGVHEVDYETDIGTCRCHSCFFGDDCSATDDSCIIDLYQGDPTMYENYWRENGDSCTTTILGWQRMSYYANSKHFFFVQTELDQVIRSLHDVIGNAVTDGRHIVIGVGSTQLFQAALYALSPPDRPSPTEVVSAAPFYSSYPTITDYLKSSLYRWAGDAAVFKQESIEDSYIELVTSPNNPTGEVRQPVVKGTGFLVHDLAYYWPHHTPITAAPDHDLMLFTVSKSTGHAGTRIGWAIVKDLTVAKKMAKFIELNTIGVSKDAQIRAAQILRAVTKQYRELGGKIPYLLEKAKSGFTVEQSGAKQLFHFGAAEMSYRWQRLRSVLKKGTRFSVPDFQPAWCTFFGEIRSPTPGTSLVSFLNLPSSTDSSTDWVELESIVVEFTDSVVPSNFCIDLLYRPRVTVIRSPSLMMHSWFVVSNAFSSTGRF